MGWGSSEAVSYGVGGGCGPDLALLWLWCGPAATAPMQPLTWELPYHAGAALKSKITIIIIIVIALGFRYLLKKKIRALLHFQLVKLNTFIEILVDWSEV